MERACQYLTQEKGVERKLTSFRPVVTSAALTKDEVVGAEQVSERTRANRVHGTRLEIDQHGTGNVLVGTDFVVVHGDTLELEVEVSLVHTIRTNAVLVRDNFPELGTCERALERELQSMTHNRCPPIWLPHYRERRRGLSFPRRQ